MLGIVCDTNIASAFFVLDHQFGQNVTYKFSVGSGPLRKIGNASVVS